MCVLMAVNGEHSLGVKEERNESELAVKAEEGAPDEGQQAHEHDNPKRGTVGRPIYKELGNNHKTERCRSRATSSEPRAKYFAEL